MNDTEQQLTKDFQLHQELVALHDKDGHHKTVFDLMKTPYCSCGKRPKKLILYWSPRIPGISIKQQATMPHPPRPQPQLKSQIGVVTPTKNPLILRWIAKCEPCNWKSTSTNDQEQATKDLEIHRIIHHPPTE
jgi:hypothetical protein